jgi:hypothetical protein
MGIPFNDSSVCESDNNFSGSDWFFLFRRIDGHKQILSLCIFQIVITGVKNNFQQCLKIFTIWACSGHNSVHSI